MLEQVKKEVQKKLFKLKAKNSLSKLKTKNAVTEGAEAFMKSLKSLEPNKMSGFITKWEKEAKRKKRKGKTKQTIRKTQKNIDNLWDSIKIKNETTKLKSSVDKLMSQIEGKFSDVEKSVKKKKVKVEGKELISKLKVKLGDALATVEGSKKNKDSNALKKANKIIADLESKFSALIKESKNDKIDSEVKDTMETLQTKFSHILADNGMSLAKAEKEAKSTLPLLVASIAKKFNSSKSKDKVFDLSKLETMFKKEVGDVEAKVKKTKVDKKQGEKTAKKVSSKTTKKKC